MLLRFLVRCLVSDEADNPAVGSLGQQPEHGFGAAMVLVQARFWCSHARHCNTPHSSDVVV